MNHLYDAVAVNLTTGRVRIMSSGKLPLSAAIIVKFAVARRGLDEEFFATVEEGQYTDGDAWVP